MISSSDNNGRNLEQRKVGYIQHLATSASWAGRFVAHTWQGWKRPLADVWLSIRCGVFVLRASEGAGSEDREDARDCSFYSTPRSSKVLIRRDWPDWHFRPRRRTSQTSLVAPPPWVVIGRDIGKSAGEKTSLLLPLTVDGTQIYSIAGLTPTGAGKLRSRTYAFWRNHLIMH